MISSKVLEELLKKLIIFITRENLSMKILFISRSKKNYYLNIN